MGTTLARTIVPVSLCLPPELAQEVNKVIEEAQAEHTRGGLKFVRKPNKTSVLLQLLMLGLQQYKKQKKTT